MPPVISLSPSFNTYSNSKLAEIAARVVEEFDSDGFYGELYCETGEDSTAQRAGEGEVSKGSDDDEEDFEFAFVTSDSDLSPPIAADEIFHNGEIRPVYPVFNRDLLFGHVKFGDENNKENAVLDSVPSKGPSPKTRLPLRKLFMEERETAMVMRSSSSSEADELDGVSEETYCVWRPKAAEEEGRCKKSNSGGCYSKRWKLKDLLHRSHSDGRKENFVFLNHSNSGTKKENEKKIKETPVGGGKMKPAAAPLPPPPCNGDSGEKQRSYKQDLAGYFGNVNGLSKKIQPF